MHPQWILICLVSSFKAAIILVLLKFIFYIGYTYSTSYRTMFTSHYFSKSVKVEYSKLSLHHVCMEKVPQAKYFPDTIFLCTSKAISNNLPSWFGSFVHTTTIKTFFSFTLCNPVADICWSLCFSIVRICLHYTKSSEAISVLWFIFISSGCVDLQIPECHVKLL